MGAVQRQSPSLPVALLCTSSRAPAQMVLGESLTSLGCTADFLLLGEGLCLKGLTGKPISFLGPGIAAHQEQIILHWVAMAIQMTGDMVKR